MMITPDAVRIGTLVFVLAVFAMTIATMGHARSTSHASHGTDTNQAFYLPPGVGTY